MALYDSRGNIEYLDLNEINRFVSIYINFRARVDALDEDVRTKDVRGIRIHAQCLVDGEIAAVRSLPKELRYQTACTGTRDHDLRALEAMCKSLLRSKK